MPFKRSGSDVWYISVGGIRKSSRTTNFKEAEQIEREQNDAHRLKRNAAELEAIRRKALGLKPPRSWQEAALRWLKEKAAKKSLPDDESRLAWLRPHLDHITDLNQIDREMVDGFLSKREGVNPAVGTPANGTANRYVALIAAILNAASRDWAWGNIAPRLRRYPEVKGKDRWLRPEEWHRLANELPEHLYAPALFSLATGLRKGNVLDLKWEQIDWENRTVMVDPTEVKTGITILIPLNDAAMFALGHAKASQVRHLSYVFSYAGEPLGDYGKAWYKALKRAGVGGFNWHGFRHTFNTWLAQRGVSPEIRQRLCGWSSRQIVDRYTHFAVEHLRPHAEIIDQVLGSTKSAQTVGQQPAQMRKVL